MINDLRPGTKTRPRRRSVCAIPPIKAGKITYNPYESRDQLSSIPIVAMPTRRSHLRPSLVKFQSGKSSLYSVAAALTRMHTARRGIAASLKQTHLLSQSDMKEHMHEMNELSNSSPALPKSLAVRLRCCRASVCCIIDQGFIPFKYRDFPSCFLFLKIDEQSSQSTDSKEKFDLLISRATLNSCTVAIFVGAWSLGGKLPMRQGLGTLYLSNGRVISGDSALAMRVAQSSDTSP